MEMIAKLIIFTNKFYANHLKNYTQYEKNQISDSFKKKLKML